MLLHLCEAESVSYLDEVASIPESLDLAKSVAVEVIALLKTMVSRDLKMLGNHSGKTYPVGLLHLNALRLADIFSDDSNLRSYITKYFTEVLAAILSIPYQEFLSSWCSSDLALKEEDVSLEYEPFTMAGWILDSSSPFVINADIFESNFIATNNSQPSYAHQRTSLLVKVIANLHCFVPKICKEQERNLFLHKFVERLKMEWQDPRAGFSPPSQPWAGFSFCSMSQKAAIVYKNLRSLLGHAESLIPAFLNEEDVQLLRVFFTQLQSLLGPVEYETNRVLEIQSARGCSSPVQGNMDVDHKTKSSNLREGMSENSAFPVDNALVHGEPNDEDYGANQYRKTFEGKSTKALSEGLVETEKEVQNAETSGSDSSSTRGKHPTDQVVKSENTKASESPGKNIIGGAQEDERVESINCEEKKQRKRKRPIMNAKQVSIIERALKEEPDMQKNAASLQSWADRLCPHGSEVTSSQLRNWLNNRKARLARAVKDGRPFPEENPLPDKQDGSAMKPYSVSPETPAEERTQVSPIGRIFSGTHTSQSPEIMTRLNMQKECQTSNSNYLRLEAGQAVVLTDTQGKEIAKGKIYQVEGEWHGCNLGETKTCVVDITDLKSDRIVRLPHPSIEAGATFEEAEIKVGNMRVLWDSGRVLMR